MITLVRSAIADSDKRDADTSDGLSVAPPSDQFRGPGSVNMAHELAKLMLEHADTFLERTEAIQIALSLGMPLSEIEEYLDWLDMIRSQPHGESKD